MQLVDALSACASRMTRPLTALALLGAALLTAGATGPTAAASPSPAAGTCAAWGQLGNPVIHQTLSGVTYLGGGKALAVGWNGELFPVQDLTPRREKWTGSGWVSVKGPQPGAGESIQLEKVARIDGTNTAWAVGNGSFGARIERYDGTRFSLNRSLANRRLTSVDVAPDGSAWAVGTFDPQGAPKPMVLRYKGGRWREMTLPSTFPGGNLFSVSARSAVDVWAVGMTIPGLKPLVVRWNGSAWKRVKTWNLPDGIKSQQSQAVVAVSARRVVVVGGETADTLGAASQPLIMTWNGTGWKRATTPWQHPNGAGFQAVTVSPNGTVYAVGVIGKPSSFEALIARSSGSTWSRMPFTSVGYTPLNAVAARNDAELMGVGSVGFGTSHRTVLRCTP